MYSCHVARCLDDFPSPFESSRGFRLKDNVFVRLHHCIGGNLLEVILLWNYEVIVREKGKVFSKKGTFSLSKKQPVLLDLDKL
jgi:hypothetical protein